MIPDFIENAQCCSISLFARNVPSTNSGGNVFSGLDPKDERRPAVITLQTAKAGLVRGLTGATLGKSGLLCPGSIVSLTYIPHLLQIYFILFSSIRPPREYVAGL